MCVIFHNLFFSQMLGVNTHKIKSPGSVRLGGCKINTKHCLHLPLTVQWSHYVQSTVCFADKTLLKSKEKPCALPAERPHLSWYKQTNMERESIKKKGWNTGVSLGLASPISHIKQPCHDTMTGERERESQRVRERERGEARWPDGRPVIHLPC